jgi:hypothetical protein
MYYTIVEFARGRSIRTSDPGPLESKANKQANRSDKPRGRAEPNRPPPLGPPAGTCARLADLVVHVEELSQAPKGKCARIRSTRRATRNIFWRDESREECCPPEYITSQASTIPPGEMMPFETGQPYVSIFAAWPNMHGKSLL